MPELSYSWWNPKSEKLESETLPAVTIQVAPAPVSEVSEGVDFRLWLACLTTVALVYFQRRRLRAGAFKVWRAMNPPEQVAARHLRRACKRGDAASACAAWNQWAILTNYECEPDSTLHASVLEMQSVLYGGANIEEWRGSRLSKAFQEERNAHRKKTADLSPGFLPPLNFPNKLT